MASSRLRSMTAIPQLFTREDVEPVIERSRDEAPITAKAQTKPTKHKFHQYRSNL